MSLEIKVPAVGESIQEVIIGQWFIAEGAWVAADAPLVGLETDKATFDVPASTSGKLTRIVVPAGEKATIGTVIGIFEPSAKPDDSGKPAPAKSPAADTTSSSATGHVMPAAGRMIQEHGISASQVKPTGPGGRVLKEDVIAHVSKPAPASTGLITNTGTSSTAVTNHGKRIPMTGIRKAIARRLVEAKQNAALLTTFNECDMSNVKDFRIKYQDFFVKKYGIKLGFMSFFVKAVVDAMLRIPQIGAQIHDDHLVYPETYDIGVAVGGGKGLVVPVIRSAERLSFAEIEQVISDFGTRASAGKILPQELEGGCFTISNGGVYGSLLSTPIVNPPQSGVLGMHNIVDRPVAVDGQVVIRPMMYLALTYDHRVVDGREAVTFLKRIREAIEDPMRMILEV